MFSERFAQLPDYAFPRLRALLHDIEPGGPEMLMSLGEPKHGFPDWVRSLIFDSAESFGRYPVNEGSEELLGAISDWLNIRYNVQIDPMRQLMVLSGSREGLFNSALALGRSHKNGSQAIVLHPNPYYPCYRMAALAIGARPMGINAVRDNGFLPDYASLPGSILDRVSLAYICSPSNPQGAIADEAYLAELLELAEKHDFLIFSDECYSEIWREAAPIGAIEVAHIRGFDPERLLIFHSLSKRSALPGLRSGFVAGGPEAISRLKRLRAYAGAPSPMPLQKAAAHLWRDEAHVREGRARYQAKYTLADQAFDGFPGYVPPRAGFFLWLPVQDGEEAVQEVYRKTGIRTLPGAYLASVEGGINPAQGYLRAALVLPEKEIEPALHALRHALEPYARSDS